VRRYLEVLTTPGVIRLMLPSIFARLPLGINSLAIVLFLQHTTHSFAVAGAATGASAIGVGAGTALQGRVVDRYGTRIVVPAAFVSALFLGIVVVAGAARLPAPVAVAASLGAGLSIPPVTALLRSQYPRLFSAGTPAQLTTAFAVDTMILDAVWVCGPLVVAAIASQTSAAVALIVSAVAGVAGTALFMRGGVVATPAHVDTRHARGALASPGVVTLTIATISLGFMFGTLSVALPAFARDHGQIGAAGLLLSLSAIASILGTALYGLRSNNQPLHMIHLALTFVFPVMLVLDALVPQSIAEMAVLVVFTTAPVGSIVASRNELTAQLAVAGTETEAFGLPFAAAFLGTGIGAALGGVIISISGWQAAFLFTAGLAGASSLLVAARRSTLSPRATAGGIDAV
jgi:MFS family permease